MYEVFLLFGGFIVQAGDPAAETFSRLLKTSRRKLFLLTKFRVEFGLLVCTILTYCFWGEMVYRYWGTASLCLFYGQVPQSFLGHLSVLGVLFSVGACLLSCALSGSMCVFFHSPDHGRPKSAGSVGVGARCSFIFDMHYFLVTVLTVRTVQRPNSEVGAEVHYLGPKLLSGRTFDEEERSIQ